MDTDQPFVHSLHDYAKIITELQSAYDAAAAERAASPLAAWKLAERQRFLELLQAEGRQSLLEIGAGPGHFSLFFQQQGLAVTCTDLSPEMVRLCEQQGLDARIMDFRRLDFPPASFDSVFALNCLLHVPKQALTGVLVGLARVLSPAGLLYAGVYGGIEFEGAWPEDRYRPQRFFSFFTDEALLPAYTHVFDLVDFRTIVPNDAGSLHFQALILRRRP